MATRLRGMTMLAAIVTLCSLSHPSAAEQVGPAPSLEELLAQEYRNAEQGVQVSDVPLPETIADWGAPPTDAARANASIDQIRQELIGELPDTADRANPSDADATRATEIFRQAQKFIETGRSSAAIAALRQSLRLDPSSVQAWRSLGLLLDQQQNPIAAKAAFAEAIALGDREPLTLIRYGLLASRFREDPLAATALLTALTNSDQPADEGALLLTRTTLAEVLLRLGYVSESVRAFEVLLELPPTFEPETEFRSEINEVYRDRRRSLLRASEAAHSIGEIGLSNRFLEAAAALPGPTNTRELTVRCYILLRVGRPVAAASLVAAHVARSIPEAETIDLLRYVATQSGYGPEIEADLRNSYESIPRQEQVTARQKFALAFAALGQSPAEQTASLLDHLTAHPLDFGVLIELVRCGDPSAINRLIRIHPAMEPQISRIALDAGARVPEEAEGPLAIRAALRAGHFHRALSAALEDVDAPRTDFAMLALRVELLAQAARGSQADALLDRAAADAQTAADRVATAYAMLVRQRSREALGALEDPSLQRDGAGDILSRVGRIRALHAIGDHARALQAAQDSLQQGAGCLPVAAYVARHGKQPDDHRRLVRIAGADGVFALLQGLSAIDQEQFDLAERSLLRAWSSPLRPQEAASALVDLWERTASIERAEGWLEAESDRYPDEPYIASLLARLQSDDRRPEAALETLASCLMDRPGSDVLSRELERVLREDFAAQDRWISQARTRLTNAPNTFAVFAERAVVELAAENLDQAVSMMELASDLAPQLTPIESETINQFLESVADEIINRPRVRQETVAAYTRVFERLSAPSAGAWFGRINVASIKELPTSDELVELSRRAGQAHPNVAQEAFIHAVRAVMTANRTGQTSLSDDESRSLALSIYDRAIATLEPYPTVVLGSWIEFTQQIQDPFALGDAIRSLGEYRGPTDRRLREALAHVMFRGSARTDAQLSAQMLADGAHHLASQLSLNNQFDTARTLYEEALRAKPDHVETNNSYGYRLLELGEDVERAIAMIETAYASSSQEPHIIDSLGWARYKQGRLEDWTDPLTGRMQPGALSLLRRAKTAAIEADPTGLTTAPIVDHLGDALWASGDRDGAVREWTEAAVLATRASKGVRGIPLPLSVEVQMQDLTEAAGEKVRAASEDRDPAIADRLEDRSPR